MLFYYGRIRISFSRLRGGTKQGKYCSCLVARPSLTLQGHCLPSHSCLCLLYLFGADYIMGSCLIILIGQNGSYWGYYLYSLLSSSFDSPKTQSLAWVTRMAWLVADGAACAAGLPALEQPGSLGPHCYWWANALRWVGLRWTPGPKESIQRICFSNQKSSVTDLPLQTEWLRLLAWARM